MSAFQITPFGIVIIAAYSFAIGVIALVLSRLLKSLRWRWWLLAPPALLLMALPWAEEAWIAWHFNEACKEAGVKVYRQVDVEGFYDSTMRSGYERIRDGGFGFMEHPSNEAGKVDHIERVQEEWKKKILDRPSARYQLKYTYQPSKNSHEEPIGWKLEKVERQVIDSQTGEILGRQIHVNRGFPIYEALWAQFFGGAILTCPGPNVRPYVPPPPFPQAVLKPISKS